MPQKTPLNEEHRKLGARMVDFAGWDMPVQYTGVIEERRFVRNHAGIFDVSHMGEIEITGKNAPALTQKLTCNDVTKLKDGDCHYSALLTEKGTFVDDIIVHRLSSEHVLICVNASNTSKDFEWIKTHETDDARVSNTSASYYQIALQGPEAEKILSQLKPKNLPPKYFTFVETELLGQKVILARTGYTGERGFEIYGNSDKTVPLWEALLEAGAKPCGLGARDTLRLEAALSLYGHEIDDVTNPYEACLGWIVKLDKGDFIGRDALKIQQSGPLRKKLVGIFMNEPGIARQGAKIFSGEKEIGVVTSGTKSPTLDRAIALGYVAADFSKLGNKIEIDIHHKRRQAEITSLPFYKRT